MTTVMSKVLESKNATTGSCWPDAMAGAGGQDAVAGGGQNAAAGGGYLPTLSAPEVGVKGLRWGYCSLPSK